MSGMDVYNFLYIVSSGGGTNSNTACLGEEVDDLIEVDVVADYLIKKVLECNHFGKNLYIQLDS